MVINFLIYIVLSCGLLTVAHDVRKFGVGLLFYPYFWLYLFVVLYFAVPSIYVEEISYYYDWNFKEDSVKVVRLLVLYFLAVVLGFYGFFRPMLKKTASFPALNRSQTRVVTLVGVVLLAILLIILATQGFDMASKTVEEGYAGDAALSENYRVKSLAYICMPIIASLVIGGRFALPLLLTVAIVLLDVAQGGRTAAILPVTALYIAACVRGRKLYVYWVTPTVILIYFIGILFRPDELLNLEKIPWQVAVLGEFRETFAALPIVIDQKFDFGGNLYNIFPSYIYPLIGPGRRILDSVVANPGAELATLIGRGYGLGLNIYVEFYYYFSDLGLLLAPWAISIACVPFVYLLRKGNRQALILLCLFLITIRLAVREGLIANAGLLTYLSITLIVLPRLLWNLLLSASKRVGSINEQPHGIDKERSRI
jgi:hypothetical protein